MAAKFHEDEAKNVLIRDEEEKDEEDLDVYIVIGGGSGIGLEVVRALAKSRGPLVSVVLAARNVAAATDACNQIRETVENPANLVGNKI